MPLRLAATAAVAVLLCCAASHAAAEGRKCPNQAAYALVDGDGDCECPRGKSCMLKGSFEIGCPHPRLGGNATKFFRPDCINCECVVFVPDKCDPTSSVALPDTDGNCICSETTLCYQGSSLDAGCDKIEEGAKRHPKLLPRHNSSDKFRVDCDDCQCRPEAYSYTAAGKVPCNAGGEQCLASPSNNVGMLCEDSEWERCCDTDEHGCASKCCGKTPTWVILVIVGIFVVVCVLPAALVLRYLSHKDPGVRPAAVAPRSVVGQDNGDDTVTVRLSKTQLDLLNDVQQSRPGSAVSRGSFLSRPGSGMRRTSTGAVVAPAVHPEGERGPRLSEASLRSQASTNQQRRSLGRVPLMPNMMESTFQLEQGLGHPPNGQLPRGIAPALRVGAPTSPSGPLPPMRGSLAQGDIPFPPSPGLAPLEYPEYPQAGSAAEFAASARPASAKSTASRPGSAASRMWHGLL